MKLFRTLLAMAFILTTTFACSNDNDPHQPEIKVPETISAKTISAKWLTKGETSIYKSFEFNQSGDYIVTRTGIYTFDTTIENETKIIYGKYKIVDDKTVQLEGLGTLSLNKIESDQFDFTFTTLQNTKHVIEAQRAEEMKKTSRTELLCRTWDYLTYTNGDTINTDGEGTVLFSEAGTYFVTYTDEHEAGELARWKWLEGSDETQLLYSWDDGEIFDNEDFATIEELTENKLIMKEVVKDNNIDYSYTYILTPTKNDTKSATIRSLDTKKHTKGFLGR